MNNMEVIINKQTLNLELSDKRWFKRVNFDGRHQLSNDGSFQIRPLLGVQTLSSLAEFVFAMLVCALALFSLFLAENYLPFNALVITLSLFLFIFLIKRCALIRKFGFAVKNTAEISNNQIVIKKGAMKNRQDVFVMFGKDDIQEIVVNYTIKGQGKKADKAQIHQLKLIQNNGDEVALDGQRVCFYNILYLLVYFKYPVKYVNMAVDAAGTMTSIFLRLISLGALGIGIVYIASKAGL